MTPQKNISMDQLFNLDGLHQANLFTDPDPFYYLGGSLKQWILKVLAANGVKDSPVLHGEVSTAAHISGAVYIAKGARVEPTAMIEGPCYIGPDTEVRHGAYIRGNVYVGAKCVVGHTTEAKGSVFLDGAKAGHFAYVGDSILGRNSNLGAGTKLANLKFNGEEISYRSPQDKTVLIKTGLRKMGALMGDHTDTGCNAVLGPGSILFPKTAVLPCVFFRGTLVHGFGTA